MDDDGDMAEMYLTEKKSRMEASFYGDQSVLGYRSNDIQSISAPVSPVSSPPDTRKLEKSLSIARSRHESMRSSDSTTDSVEELEMLLEAYFVVIDSTLNKLTSVSTAPTIFNSSLSSTIPNNWIIILLTCLSWRSILTTPRTSLTFSWYVSSPLTINFAISLQCLLWNSNLDWWHVMLHVHFEVFEDECSYS